MDGDRDDAPVEARLASLSLEEGEDDGWRAYLAGGSGGGFGSLCNSQFLNDQCYTVSGDED